MNSIAEKINLKRLGGLAAVYGALAYIVTMIVFLVILDYPNVTEPYQKVDMIVNHQNILITLNWVAYIIFGVFLVLLSLALHEKLHTKHSSMMNIATIFGIMWATLLMASGLISNQGIAAVVSMNTIDSTQAALLWQSIEATSSALSFVDGELLGGLWMLFIGMSAQKANDLSKPLNFLCIGIGSVGIISIIPFINMLSALFGLGQIVWFIWIGIYLLKDNT